VRIAVVVDADGRWASSGCRLLSQPSDDTLLARVSDLVGNPRSAYFLEADLPLPAEAVEMEARVCEVAP
jgi:hypothetical protein